MIHINEGPQSGPFVIQNKSGQGQAGNQNINTFRLNLKANLTCNNCGDKRHLAKKCPHTGTIKVPKSQPAQPSLIFLKSQAGAALLPKTNSISH